MSVNFFFFLLFTVLNSLYSYIHSDITGREVLKSKIVIKVTLFMRLQGQVCVENYTSKYFHCALSTSDHLGLKGYK